MAKLNDNELLQVRRFLDFDLSGTELEAFMERFESDPAFAKEVDEYSGIYKSVEALKVQDAPWSPPELPPHSPKGEPATDNVGSSRGSQGLMKVLLPLALIVGVLVGGWFWMNSSTEVETQEVFAAVETYTKKISGDVVRGDGTFDPSADEGYKSLQGILADYESGKDKDALNKAQALLNDSQDVSVRELAHWWVVNIYLKQGNENAAVAELKRIRENGDYNSNEKATQFLNELGVSD